MLRIIFIEDSMHEFSSSLSFHLALVKMVSNYHKSKQSSALKLSNVLSFSLHWVIVVFTTFYLPLLALLI